MLASLAACAGSPPSAEPEAHPQSVGVLVDRATVARARGDYDATILSYRAALDRTPWNTRLQRALAVSYAERGARHRRRGSLPSAERDLRDALLVLPGDPDLERSLAVILIERAERVFDPAQSQLLRSEARALAPALVDATPPVRADLERRLDLAFELIQRGQLEAGIARLEALHRGAPDHPGVARLLAEARVRQATLLSQKLDHAGAARALDRAVELYLPFGACGSGSCELEEVRRAHHNRIVAWLSAHQADSARRALEDAERLGLEFPELRSAVGD